jgi:hypothetical protein
LTEIAHGFAVGEIGLSNLDQWLVDLINDRAPEAAPYFIGDWPSSRTTMPIRGQLLHQIGLGVRSFGQRWAVCVRTKLFAGEIYAPAYVAVAGELARLGTDLLPTG